MLVVDDCIARGTRSEVARTYANAERLLRAQGNQAGRGQLTSKVELRNAFHPRGIVLATGEDIPNGLSLQALLVLIKVALGASETSTRKALAWLAAVTSKEILSLSQSSQFLRQFLSK